MSIDETIINLVADTVRKTIAETSNGHHEEVQILTIPQAAALLKIDKSTVYGWIREGRIKAINLGDQRYQTLRIHRSELDRFLRECPPAYDKQ
jgi:excisionase family DNA binding protein